jgi:hypothetical protein
MELPIVDTPDVQATVELLRDSAAAKAIGVITGPNGSGKTEALRAVEKMYGKLGMLGTALYYRCHLNKRNSRGIKDILDSLGVRQAAFQSGASLQYAVKMCLAELKKKKIHALLIDEADLWTRDSLLGLIGLFDMALLEKYPLAMVLASTGNPDLWLAPVASAKSRTLKITSFEYMDRELMGKVMRKWGTEFESWLDLVEKKDATALKVLTRIHKLTAGNFRRLGHFASLHLTYFKNQQPNPENVELVSTTSKTS